MPTALWLALALAAPPTATDQARQLARRSILEYDTGAYAKSLSDIEQAYELDPRPALLYNVGLCHRALGHHRQAALAFKSYIREVPQARNLTQARTFYAEMDKLALEDEARAPPEPARTVTATPAPAPEPTAPTILVEAPPPSAAAPTEAVSAPRAKKRLSPMTWVVGGTGIAAGVVGTVLYVLATGALAQDKTVTSGGLTEHSLPYGQFSSAATEGNAGEVLWGVGGALLVGAGVIALVTGSK